MSINLENLDLQPSLLEMVEILIENQFDYVSTLDFLRNGVLSPAAGIVRLKSKGAVIETVTRSVTDTSGRVRKGIAHYKLVEWL